MQPDTAVVASTSIAAVHDLARLILSYGRHRLQGGIPGIVTGVPGDSGHQYFIIRSSSHDGNWCDATCFYRGAEPFDKQLSSTERAAEHDRSRIKDGRGIKDRLRQQLRSIAGLVIVWVLERGKCQVDVNGGVIRAAEA